MALISAHRGGAEVGAEGSLEAYQAALASGADFVELDVRRTASGALVCSHDLPKPGRRPATLDEVLNLVAAAGAGAHVDLKESGYEAELVATVSRHLSDERVWYTTGDDSSVRALVSLRAPTLLTLGRRFRDRRPFARIANTGAAGVAVRVNLATSTLRTWCRARELVVLVWTVNDDARLRALLGATDVDVVVTDLPAHAVAIRAALESGDPGD